MDRNRFQVKFTGKNDRQKFNMIRNLWTEITDDKGRFSRVQFVSMREQNEIISFGLKYISSNGKKSGMVRINEILPIEIIAKTTLASVQTLHELSTL
ncbi:MAG: hypothetical protein M0P12_00365 [Paludibacteraceae bacterium]|jgi:hypothetical protein|nr:hypothetical protein [Paludibacteraceae bacterium]MCK9616135.1 hypothetical protein [Candidatus Omnitrophota bacterium]